MENFEFDNTLVEEMEAKTSWIAAALCNSTSFAMNLVLIASVVFWMVG